MKMKKNYSIIAIAILLISFTPAATNAQENDSTAEASFNFSGTVDTYFRTSFSEDPVAPATSFADLNGFALGMANFIVSYEGEKSGFVADVVFGPRGSDAVFGSEGNSSELVNQLYAYYHLGDGVTVTMGNFNTFLGYEVISPAANFNYSTSYLFSYGPFSHTGLKLDAALSDDISLMLGVMNQTDYTEGNFDSAGNGAAFDKYMFGAQLGLYGQYLNLLAGKDYTQIDYTGGFDLSEGFYLGINASKASLADGAEFSGVALYPQIGLSEDFSLGLRGEIFKDNGAGILGDGELDNTSLTLTGSYSSGNFTFKPEFRLDKGSEAFYANESGNTDSLSSFVLAAIYSF